VRKNTEGLYAERDIYVTACLEPRRWTAMLRPTDDETAATVVGAWNLVQLMRTLIHEMDLC